MLEVLFLVVFDLLAQISVESRLVEFFRRSVEKPNVLELSCASDRSVEPLAVHEEKAPIEDRDVVLDRRALEGMAVATVAVGEALANALHAQRYFVGALFERYGVTADRFDVVFKIHVALDALEFEILSANEHFAYFILGRFVEHLANSCRDAFARGVLVGDVARSLHFVGEFEILPDGSADWDAFVEDVRLELLEGIFVSLRLRRLFSESITLFGKTVSMQWSM